MSKKKKGKGKGKKKGKGKDGGAEKEYKLKLELDRANQQIETFERFLVLRSEQSQQARLEKDQMKERLNQLNSDFETEKNDRFLIASDMIRQYKAMESNLIEKINKAQQRAANLEDQLAYANIALDEQKKKYESLLEEKQKEIESQKQKMEDMVGEFQEMLKDVLSKMGQSINDSTMRNYDQKLPNIFQNEKLKDIIGSL